MNKIFLVILVLTMVSCNDDFMERYPKTEITKENFFKTAGDLDTYINGLYGNIGASYDDIGSDNIAQREAKDATWDLIHGATTSENVGGWSWSSLRAINFFLDNYGNAEATEMEKSHYAGIARFFRAHFYISKVKSFSDVPWLSKPLETTDEDLYKTQDPRGLIVDSIIADLQYAAEHITINNSDKTRITKYAALASLARFALYEGTFRKYAASNSTEAAYLSKRNASDYKSLLNIAADASQEIIGSGKFSLCNDYESLFNSTNLYSNSEIILFSDYEKDTRMHGSYTRLDWQYCLSQNLVDEYLNADGSSLSVSELDTLQFRNSFVNRDARLSATVSYAGFVVPGQGSPHVAKTLFGGYGQIKYTPKEPDGWSWGKSYNDLPIYRYGEVLLINAEAHAELGTLSNAILDNTINLLRQRAGLTGGNVSLGSSVDPLLESRYQNVQATPKGAALEIRRERRVELACEGLRFDDLMRWHLGDAILTVNGKPENLQRGMYVPKMTITGGAKFTLLEVTGDDVEDIIIAETANDLVLAEAYFNGLSEEAAELYKSLNKVSLEETIALEHGDEGHIIWKRELNDPGTFVEPKYYYRPVPNQEILLNENLKQHEFWN